MTFVATQNKGFGMTFDNGFTISVQWGTENYCEHKNLDIDFEDLPNPKEENRWESRNAEIAVFNDKGIVPIGGGDQVIGWLSTGDVAKVIAIVSSAHPDNQEEMVEEINELKI
jgi:hypothetical protein